MSKNDPHTLQNDLVRIVESAHTEILAVYNTSFAVDRKLDDSPITEADRRSHEAIFSALEAIGGGIPIVSEEGSVTPFAERRHWTRFWLIDPLDGTKEFVKRSGEFTVNIALVEGHRPVVGVVGIPASKTVYYGDVQSSTAFCIEDGQTRAIHTRALVRDNLTVLMSRRRRNASADEYLRHLEHEFGSIERESFGSSLKFLKLASGEADLHLQYGLTSEWDTAAAHAILLAAGGGISTFDGDTLKYNCKESLLNQPFIAYGDKSESTVAGLSRYFHVFSNT